eukprot:CAMPEP_0117511640 /NCGR_PEP_ID=MMETSP0784-20121206/28613_1 /TAXON_ID=39447 /ORGANISM="" /LENGTH=497 /DNA_ID=CAMNT_0005307321 /DNA_START=121 /DNA_END=1614 /DNA_ORIENTATION=+
MADSIVRNSSNVDFDFRYSLRGVRLHVGVSDFQPFSVVDVSLPDGVGDGLRFRGPAVTLLDRMARQFGVEAVFWPMRPFNFTHEHITDYILEHVGQYDLLVGPFLALEVRRKRGIVFTTAVADFSLQLYMERPPPAEPTIWDNAFFWTKPFDWSGYAVVLLVWVVPSFMLWHLDADREPGVDGLAQALWRGFLIMVGIKGAMMAWKPRTKFGRGIAALWALVALVMTYLYLGNLMRFMIYEAERVAPVKGISDFAARGYRLCISDNYAMQLLGQSYYTGSKMLSMTKRALPKAVMTGQCQGFLERTAVGQVMLAGGQPQFLPEDGGEPYGCRLKAVGRPIVELSAAYATHLQGCKGIIADIVSAWLQGKKEDTTIQRLMRRMVDEAGRSANGEPACSSTVQGGAGVQRRLRAVHLLGLVLVTFVPMLVMYGAALMESKRRPQAFEAGGPEPGQALDQALDAGRLRLRNAELEAAVASHASALAALVGDGDRHKTKVT